MSSQWTDGYQTTVNYTYGYYKDLSPNYQRFCLLLNGVDCPEPHPDHKHCELGFGQGVSINIHAAASLSTFYGTDFNPAHAAHATSMAQHSQVNQQFYDDSFEELLERDLPQFDSISLHGIWSWISHENQHIILKFIRKFLKPNGIVYISYNCVTGWAANMPIRELFHSHFKFNSTSTNPIQNVSDALEFSEQLLKQAPNFAKRNPNALQKVQELKKQNPNYLIHEYLNQDWQCFSFQQVVKTLEDIKLTYAASTDLNTHLDNINFSNDHQNFLNGIEHPIFKEQCRDYFANSQFRRDLFIRGKNTLSPLQMKEKLSQLPFVLLIAPEQFPKTIQGYLGEFNLLPEVYEPIGEIFKSNEYRPVSIAEMEQKKSSLNYSKLINAMTILCHLGLAQPCQPQPTEVVLEQAQRLNRYLLEQGSYHANYAVLSNPLTGMGLPTDHFSQLFYRAHFIDKLNTVKELAEYVFEVIHALNWLVLDKDGNKVTDRKSSLKIIQDKAQRFIDSDRLKIAKQLRLFD